MKVYGLETLLAEVLMVKSQYESEIESLQVEIAAIEQEKLKLQEQQIDVSEHKRLREAYKRLDELCETIVNRLLRQTIASKSHGERNTELRALCSDIIHIQTIADDMASKIPF